MTAFLVSTVVVALGEIGDKTQLLALLLAARFKRPWPILAGILVATLANHALAGMLGAWVRDVVSPDLLRWILGISFFAVAAWALIPDKMDEMPTTGGQYGVFLVTLVTFFLVEIGDKTQVATMMLAAKYQDLFAVVMGTTLGMLLANVPVVWLGEFAAKKLSFKLVRYIAAILFALLGLVVILGFQGI